MSTGLRLVLITAACLALGGCLSSGGTANHVDAQLARHGV